MMIDNIFWSVFSKIFLVLALVAPQNRSVLWECENGD